MVIDQKKTQRIRWILFGTGFLFALLAYYPAMGEVEELQSIWDVLYYAFRLMTGSFPLADVKNGWIQWAKFLCPATTGAVFISFFSSAVNQLWIWLRSLEREVSVFGKTLGKNAVAIYGTNDLVRSAAEGTRFIQAEDRFQAHAKNHIILMDSDDDSLRFYKEHEARLSKGSTHIGLRQMSSFLMKSSPDVSCFSIYEEVARAYWKDQSIRTTVAEDPVYDIVILGYCRDNLGYQLLRYGLMNNLFRKDQKITYHVFCDAKEAERGFETLNTVGMLGDRVVWHTQRWQQCLEVIQGTDRILLCRTVNPHILNQLLLICTRQQIHYYDPDNASYPEKFQYRHMAAFGCTRKVLNEGSILKNELYRDAMERHFRYMQENGTEQEQAQIRKAMEAGKEEALKLQYWSCLSGFLKSSNAAASDYYTAYPVRPDMTQQELEERAELEHDRWCRFHFLCGWQYGEPADGERKDAELRIHRDLVPWEMLTEQEKEKDRQQVKMECPANRKLW